MKNIRFLLFLGLALSSVPAQAQFKRSTDSNAYPYTVTLGSDYVFIIGRPGVTNYNYASSNLFISVTNIAAYQAFLATNNLLGTITNIASAISSVGPWLTNLETRSTVWRGTYSMFMATNSLIGDNAFTTIRDRRVSGHKIVGGYTGSPVFSYNAGYISWALESDPIMDINSGTNDLTVGNATASMAFGSSTITHNASTFTFNGPVSGNLNIGQFTTNTMFSTIQKTGATNFNVVIGTIYQKVVATNDVAFTNVSGVGMASVRVLPNGASRYVYFPTNWAWLGTNNFTLSGSQWRAQLTDGASRIGWLSVVSDGTVATNVAALWRQTP